MRIQIVLESIFLTLIAGVLGIILGAVTLATINFFTQDLADFPYTNPNPVPTPLVLGALLIMTVMGTLIGLIPAQRAVSIKPIDALREEQLTTPNMKILKNTAIAFLFFGMAFAMGYFVKTNAKSLIEYETKTPKILSIENKTVVTGKVFLRMRLRLNLKYQVLSKNFLLKKEI